MILELFIALVGIALIFIGIGVYSDDLRVFGIIGSLFLFLLGILVVIPNSLEVKNGSTITDLGGGVTSNVYNYQSYNDDTTHYVGYFLSMVGVLGIILIPIIKVREED